MMNFEFMYASTRALISSPDPRWNTARCPPLLSSRHPNASRTAAETKYGIDHCAKLDLGSYYVSAYPEGELSNSAAHRVQSGAPSGLADLLRRKCDREGRGDAQRQVTKLAHIRCTHVPLQTRSSAVHYYNHRLSEHNKVARTAGERIVLAVGQPLHTLMTRNCPDTRL